MLLKFLGPQGPLIHPKIPKAIQVGEVFDCSAPVAADLQKVAPKAFAQPTDTEVEVYRLAHKTDEPAAPEPAADDEPVDGVVEAHEKPRRGRPKGS